MTTTDEELIAAAIAAGKVRRIPMGAQLGSAEGPRYAVTDPRDSAFAPAVALVLKKNPGLSPHALLKKVWLARYAPGALTGLDHQHIAALLRVLQAHGWARQKGDQWFPARGMPEIEAGAVRARLAARAAQRAAAYRRRTT